MDWCDVEEEEEANEEEEGRAKADPDQHDLKNKLEKNKGKKCIFFFGKSTPEPTSFTFQMKIICGEPHS